MGYDHYIMAYRKGEEGYFYEEVYAGQSFWKAYFAFRKAKQSSGCVKWEWRG